MSEQQPVPYNHDGRDTVIDELIRAVREYCSLRVLHDESQHLGPSRAVVQATEKVRAAREKLKAQMLTP